MKLIFNKTLLISKFLNPINKLTDKCTISIKKDGVDCVSYSTGNNKQTIIFYCNLNLSNEIEDEIKLNIGSVKRLISLINCINNDSVELNVEKNNISYSSKEVQFKYHLLEDLTMEKSIISVDKINGISYDFEFMLSSSKLDEILKASSTIGDLMPSNNSNKIYFYTKDTILYGELNDKTLVNLDNVTLLISDKYIGNELKENLPLNVEIFKIMHSLKFDNINIKINTEKGIVCLSVQDKDFQLKYIVTAQLK